MTNTVIRRPRLAAPAALPRRVRKDLAGHEPAAWRTSDARARSACTALETDGRSRPPDVSSNPANGRVHLASRAAVAAKADGRLRLGGDPRDDAGQATRGHP